VSSSSQSRVVPLPILAKTEDPDSSRTPPRTQYLTDEEAMRLLSEREDQEALHFLFQRYSKLVCSIGLRVLRDLSEAEEVVQEVFLYVYEKAELFDARKGSAKGWIVQLAFHRSLDRQSRWAR
jgi:RNA polymerase sigma-70 factor (ECF subfamily)